jgi:DNA polymerase (family 10)
MDPRTAGHVLTQISDLLELTGENRFKSRAYRTAASAVLEVVTDDLCPMYRDGSLAKLKGIGPATLGVIGDLCETGESRYFEQLRERTPEGLLEMLRVPGLGISKIQALHEGLGISTVQELETAAREGRLAKLKGFGAKTAEKILKGITYLRSTTAYILYPHALIEARRLLAMVEQHPDVDRALIAGSLRRRRETVRDIDIVVACRTTPAAVAASFARAGGVRDVVGAGGRSISIRYVDGTLLDLHCVEPERFAIALWRATGSEGHMNELRTRATERGLELAEDELRDTTGTVIPVVDEVALYDALDLPYIEPELREGRGEIDAASRRALPSLIAYGDIKGVLHCHSQYSDGKATIAEMAAAAKARGWSYIGISDHSESAFYASGLSRDALVAQHEEIDRLNEGFEGIKVLKGIEADILADGRVDYDDEILERFDFVIGSVHSRFGMDRAAMTDRVLKALDNPHLTILGHPTGRLLLTREPYALDMDAVLDKAAELGVVVELNADPHRLDLDWQHCHAAKDRGVAVAIGPDAHSIAGLDCVELGVGIARKAWLEPSDVVNTWEADAVVERARARRART